LKENEVSIQVLGSYEILLDIYNRYFCKKGKMFNYCIDVDNDVVNDVMEETNMIVENVDLENNETMDAVENTDSNNFNSQGNYPIAVNKTFIKKKLFRY